MGVRCSLDGFSVFTRQGWGSEDPGAVGVAGDAAGVVGQRTEPAMNQRRRCPPAPVVSTGSSGIPGSWNHRAIHCERTASAVLDHPGSRTSACSVGGDREVVGADPCDTRHPEGPLRRWAAGSRRGQRLCEAGEGTGWVEVMSTLTTRWASPSATPSRRSRLQTIRPSSSAGISSQSVVVNSCTRRQTSARTAMRSPLVARRRSSSRSRRSARRWSFPAASDPAASMYRLSILSISTC